MTRISLIKSNCDPSTYHLSGQTPPTPPPLQLLCNLSIDVSKKQKYELCCFIGPFIYICIYIFFLLPGFLPGESHGDLKRIGHDLVTKQHIYLSMHTYILQS